MLRGKNILFISPEFFGIDKSIMRDLRSKGANVLWFDERSVKSSFLRAINSVNSNFFYFQSNKYYKQKISEINANIDIVLVIKGEMISAKSMHLIRKKWPAAEVVLYLYDPVKNIKGILNKINLYDKVISFEPDDCKKYGFEFRPLFCDFEKEKKNVEIHSKNKICFYGTMYGDRFKVVYNIREYCKREGLSFYSFCFLRGKFMVAYYWITNAFFRKLGVKEMSFVPKKSSEIAELVNESEIILDVNDINQRGLTIRTLETLVSRKKMITTNEDIIKYDFYREENICVIDRDDIVIPKYFLDTAYKPIEENILKKYTASGWVNDVFKEE